MSGLDRLGDFVIVEEIGRGGFGIVYRARQISLDRPVALKVLYQNKVHTKEEIGRFEREARASARLDHPAIVSVYAWGEDDGNFFIAQKLIGSGRTLADEIAVFKQTGEAPKGHFRRVAKCLAMMAQGLHHAHERGIVHRDVKPSNVLLDNDEYPFLGDFGLAKVEDGLELSRTGEFAGSPYYMAPEQADSRRGEVDARSDVYALGSTLYELLTLHPPFEGKSGHEVIRKILTEDPRPPSRFEGRVPTDLETICLKAMEKSPVRRYQTAADMAADLQAYLEGEPIQAAPPSTVSRILRKARRNRAGVGMGLLGAVIIALVVVVVQSSKKAQNRIEELGQAAAEERAELLQQAGQAEEGAHLDRAANQAFIDATAAFDKEIEEALLSGDSEEAARLLTEKTSITHKWNEIVELGEGSVSALTESDTYKELEHVLNEEGFFAFAVRLADVATTGAEDEPGAPPPGDLAGPVDPVSEGSGTFGDMLGSLLDAVTPGEDPPEVGEERDGPSLPPGVSPEAVSGQVARPVAPAPPVRGKMARSSSARAGTPPPVAGEDAEPAAVPAGVETAGAQPPVEDVLDVASKLQSLKNLLQGMPSVGLKTPGLAEGQGDGEINTPSAESEGGDTSTTAEAETEDDDSVDPLAEEDPVAEETPPPPDEDPPADPEEETATTGQDA